MAGLLNSNYLWSQAGSNRTDFDRAVGKATYLRANCRKWESCLMFFAQDGNRVAARLVADMGAGGSARDEGGGDDDVGGGWGGEVVGGLGAGDGDFGVRILGFKLRCHGVLVRLEGWGMVFSMLLWQADTQAFMVGSDRRWLVICRGLCLIVLFDGQMNPPR
ncbi:uncharacterized protein BO80DRAFT_89034 [Aspergillus ibericus CBS 121593]|uniref:Uncharacterized protein n=1 Tax=Aspergillus ibericus CBS 121593 TaxID=1448316 RepID=A0A395H1Z2_9EURO|nr:hypothetical protein BO80DRAFT_89034 [Aspergillus ibericus CBS 121593]RAL00868.1 hypothetical protein BO80DRAFT_89034 [Aspergillus ibericus CBS 121593]